MKEKVSFESEFILHTLTQAYLKELFDLELVASEIQLHGLRLDNLAFDNKTCSFVIIEYKNEMNLNVFNQAQEYYNLVCENKEFFLNRLENKGNVDFDSLRVMIIGPEFSDDQIKSSNDIFELWKISLFDSGEVTYENMTTHETKSININLDDLKHTERLLLMDKTDEMRQLYYNLKDRILSEFSDVDLSFQVNQFSFKTNGKLVCVVRFLKSSFTIYLFGKDLENSERTIDNSNSSGLNADYKLKYSCDDDFEYFLDLFRQTYNQKVRI